MSCAGRVLEVVFFLNVAMPFILEKAGQRNVPCIGAEGGEICDG